MEIKLILFMTFIYSYYSINLNSLIDLTNNLKNQIGNSNCYNNISSSKRGKIYQ